VVFVFVLLSLSFASANIFSDLWGKFTGKVIDGLQQCVSCAAPPAGCYYDGASCKTCGALVCKGEGGLSTEIGITNKDSSSKTFVEYLDPS